MMTIEPSLLEETIFLLIKKGVPIPANISETATVVAAIATATATVTITVMVTVGI